LPCGPILGEGKPENQNLGLVFTCGERVALIDMNQDGYFEQALLVRNLLQEFIVDRTKGEGGRGGSGSRPHVTIVGYPEHIFTQSAGFVTAIYMAMQVVARPPGMRARLVGEGSCGGGERWEGWLASGPALHSEVGDALCAQERYFGTLFQRVLDKPLEARFHYGHPDLMDKSHHISFLCALVSDFAGLALKSSVAAHPSNAVKHLINSSLHLLLFQLHFLSHGGVSKASKEVNLSEDVFAGYKTILRGGRVVFREYHQVGKGRMTNLGEISAFFAKLSQGAACQVMSRDLYRLMKALPLDQQARLTSPTLPSSRTSPRI
ncbi:MAG: hypothetical protein SGPRY_004475, partial [Prymnesium sp.]